MVQIIGIDCATQPQKTGLAKGVWDGTAVSLQVVTLGQKKESVAHTIAGWLSEKTPTLIAIDAPLGWPADLGPQLETHLAGNYLPGLPNTLFRRETDRHIWQRTGKLPLDVGADRIARTAHAALTLLEELRQITGCTIPLAWDPQLTDPISAIEVYPAGTLKMMFDPMKVPSYKGKDGRGGRKMILDLLRKIMVFSTDPILLQKNDDSLDAALCVLAGADFLCGRATPPQNLTQAKKEGWIWTREKKSNTNE